MSQQPTPSPPHCESNVDWQSADIPIRNIWLLLVYASDFFRNHYKKLITKARARNIDLEETPEKLPEIIAEILTYLVDRRLRRNLSLGYQSHTAALTRVRGRIDALQTERRLLLSRGKIACRFEELSIDTPRNRLVRAALLALSARIEDKNLACRCTVLANTLLRLGVSGEMPSESELAGDLPNRCEEEDQQLVTVAKLVFDLLMLTETQGREPFFTLERDRRWLCQLYEKAIGGFYKVKLSDKGWNVYPGKRLEWTIEHKTLGLEAIFPRMQADIILENKDHCRIVIDTKFTSILRHGYHRNETLSSNHIYQIYTYLCSQEEQHEPGTRYASGLLLYPAINQNVDETAVIQGHAIHFTTVDLAASSAEIRYRLLEIVERCHALNVQIAGRA